MNEFDCAQAISDMLGASSFLGALVGFLVGWSARFAVECWIELREISGRHL
jgi:hypothetical protein